MLQLTKIISTELDKAGRRLIKILRFGKNDYQTPMQAGPFGVDSNPIKDMIAVFGPTSEKGEKVIIGYIHRDQLAQVGEHRTFSTNEDGELQTYVWLKNNGFIEIGGSEKNLVRYQELEEGFNQLKEDFNNHIQKWNTFAAAYTPGSSSSVGTPPTVQQSDPSTASIEGAKIEELKTL